MDTKLPLGLLLLLCPLSPAQERYKKPPSPILDILETPANPSVSFSPVRTHFLLTAREGMPSIAVVARPVLALAGRKIDPSTRGGKRGAKSTGFTLVTVESKAQRPIEIPPNSDLGGASWTADGKRFAFTNTFDDRIELWIADVETAKAKKVDGVRLCATHGGPFRWMPDQKRILATVVPAGDAKPPQAPAAPAGPFIEETAGKKAPVRTFADLLKNEHDAALFEFYMTSQLVLVDPDGNKVTPIGAPGLVSSYDASPDGKYILTARTKRPFSYFLGSGGFPKDVDVIDFSGKLVKRIADMPSSEGVPTDGVQEGPRGVRWDPLADASLIWTEALDKGDPANKVPHRDRLVRLAAPFEGQPAEWHKTQHRCGNVSFGEGGKIAFVSETDRDTKWQKTWRLTPADPSKQPVLYNERNSQDAYKDPGSPLTRVNARGDGLIHVEGDCIYLDGAGASPKGSRPFLTKLNLSTDKKEPLFTCGEGVLENVVGLLAPDASRLLIQSESPTVPPNYFALDTKTGKRDQLTNLEDPTARFTKGIEKKLLQYKRGDGTPLTATLYLPPGYKQGEKLPFFVWAYPREYTDGDIAGQVRGSPNRYTRISGASHLFPLLCGYGVLDDPTMPIIGTPEKANDTYVTQLVEGAKAAVEEIVKLGVADRDRIAVGGHSYGSFMTANLLAHCDLFRAGVARSGAFNRTLTPFGFQSERRHIWQAPEVYMTMSPFMHAHKINEPILIIHGDADTNSGTFPIQSQRFYHAVKGNGGTARFVFLPFEDHGYGAKESVMHVCAETIEWLDKHVKNAGPRQLTPADASQQRGGGGGEPKPNR